VRGVIDAPANVAPAMQAYMVHYTHGRIALSESANDRRGRLITEGALLATLAPLVLAIGMIVARGLG
jgi:hypothetical protein